MSENSKETKGINNIIQSRGLRSRRAMLLAFGGAVGAAAVVGITHKKAHAGNKKADYQDLDSNSSDNSDHYGGTSDSD